MYMILIRFKASLWDYFFDQVKVSNKHHDVITWY